ncbi:MAG TPA: TonB-dependent receptor [Chitinophagaceae bacterium]|nr:TonB-dependent receptor [Chitinophagaceae bacterium]
MRLIKTTIKKSTLITLLVMFGCSFVVAQTNENIKGRVLSQSDEPIPGVTIINENEPSAQTQTDEKGEFAIYANKGDVIGFRAVGYMENSLVYEGQSFLNVRLEISESSLDEVVVVGYGTQRRKDLVGSVEQIGGEQLQNRANMNIARALQGTMPGLNITMRDGKPSRGAGLNLRGTSSIGAGGSALILIDGVEGDLTTVNPDDVESVSVLKDASSAAIYGARGAFGVVLITTKSAKEGKPRITYNGGISSNSRIVKMEDNIISNGLEWTDAFYRAWVEGMDNGTTPAGINNVFKYSTDWYNELQRRNSDPTFEKMRTNDDGEYEYFGNTNWFDVIYKDYNLSQEHSLSVSGGNERAKYFVSGRYFNQDGIYNAGNEKYDQYNARAKGEVKIIDNLVLTNSTDFIRRNIHQPMVMYDRQLLPRMLEHQGYPMTLEKNLDGTWTEAAVYTGWAGFVEGTSYQHNNKFDLRNTTALTYKTLDEQLIFNGDFTYLYNNSDRTRVENMYDFYTGPNTRKSRQTFSSLEYEDYNNKYLSSNITVNYIPKNLGPDHSLNILLGWNTEEKLKRNYRTYRRGLLYPEKPSFALMDGDYYVLNQTGNEWAYAGALFRVNYNFLDRYLFEVSGRYDGSSKFPLNQQWGFFPSGSFGWRVSEESFAQDLTWVNDLKLRASIGSLGNGNVDPFLYLPTMDIKRSSLIIDDGLQTYTYAPANIPSSLTWERATTYNIGLDFTFLDNKMSFIGDYFHRYTSDMFTVGPEVPHVFGADIPKGNYADLKTKGWELSLQWRDQFELGSSPLNYSIRGMVWDSRTWITKYNNESKSLSTHYVGKEMGEIWGYKVEGLFKDQEEIDQHHVDQSRIVVSSSNVLKPGDLKFKDLDGNNEINNGDNTLENPGDRAIIGNSTPRMLFGLNADFDWKGFSLGVVLQGVGQRDWYPAKESGYFWGQYNRPYGYYLKHHTGNNVWTEENPNPEAYWPRYRGYLALNANRSMTVTNDRFLQNAAYIRLKNLQFGYTINNRITSKWGVERLRIYLSGENIYTWSPMFKITKNFDPEVIHAGDTDFRSSSGTDGDGYGYPMQRTFTLGVNLTF